jgi:hypothetical protein
MKTTKTPSLTPIESFLALSEMEKEAVYQSVDREFSQAETKPLSAAERRLWAKAKRKPGRPQIGAGAARVPISIERTLLKRVDDFAKSHKLSRSQVLARGAKLILSQ